MLNPLQQTGFLIHLESLLAIFAEQGPHKDSRSQQDPASPREKEGLSRMVPLTLVPTFSPEKLCPTAHWDHL